LKSAKKQKKDQPSLVFLARFFLSFRSPPSLSSSLAHSLQGRCHFSLLFFFLSNNCGFVHIIRWKKEEGSENKGNVLFFFFKNQRKKEKTDSLSS